MSFFFSLKRSHLWCLNTFSAQRSFCFVLAWCMWCGLCHTGRKFTATLAPLAASHTSAHPPGLMFVCLFVGLYTCVCVCISFWVLALALAAYSVPLSLLFTLSVFLYMHTRHPQPCTGNEHPPKRHPGRLLSKSTRGQSVLVWHNRRTSFVLFWCSQFKQREECWERGTILLRGGGKDGRREGERSSERNKVREQEGDRFVCVHVCVCTGGDKSKRGNGSAESAFYSLQLHT